MTVEEGVAAPDIDLKDQDGEDFTLSSQRGRALVLFFYPRDNTPGCTTEAQGFSAAIDDFEAVGCGVVGISADSEASHRRFIDKQGLKVRLLADPDHAALEAYGVWKQKKLYGRSFLGIERSTFLVDRNGKIARMWRKVRVKNHVDEVLEAARALASA